MQEQTVISNILSDLQAPPSIIERVLPADCDTPVSAFLKLRDQGARILLESVEQGTVLGRYSFIGFKPEA